MKIIYLLLSFATISLFTGVSFVEGSNTIKLFPTDDAYVVTNQNDPDDKQGLKALNTGDLDFLKIWYANNVTKNQEKIISIGYLKFDLSDLNAENISSAELKMQPFVINKKAAILPVDVFLVASDDWSESAINFTNRQLFFNQVVDSTEISDTGKWHSWNVTDVVKQNTKPQISFALLIRYLYDNSEEQSAFYSKDVAEKQNAPYLEIVYAEEPNMIFNDLGSENLGMAVAIIGGIAAIGVAIGIKYLRKNKKQPTITQQSQASSNQKQERLSCKNCGKTIMKTFKVCPFCGTSVN